MKMRIIAGRKNEIKSSGSWAILDIGFSQNNKSCGLLLKKDGTKPNISEDLKFGKAVNNISGFIEDSKRNVNLVIEAPLSTAFNKDGNPTFRGGFESDEKNKKYRYWYMQPASTTMLATQHLLSLLKKDKKLEGKTIVLFEGFVSFKDKSVKRKSTKHFEDAEKIWKVIEKKSNGKIIDLNSEKHKDKDKKISGIQINGEPLSPPIIIKVL